MNQISGLPDRLFEIGRGILISCKYLYIVVRNCYKIYLAMEDIDNKVVIGSLFGLGIAALGGVVIYRHFYHHEGHDKERKDEHVQGEIPKTITLIGDVGGTNIRLQLIELTGKSYEETKVIKEHKYKASEF